MKPQSYRPLLKTVTAKWIEHEPFELAAALSYYTLFSLAPLLVIAITIAGFIFGREAAQDQVVQTIQGLIGEESARAIQGMIKNASYHSKTGVISSSVSLIVLLFGAGGVVGELQTSLNRIWGVAMQSLGGWRGFIRNRFISFAMVLGIGFLLLVSLVISAFIAGLTQFLGTLLGGTA
jgi:membrane protein